MRLVSDGSGGNTAAVAAAVRITGLRFDSSAAQAPSQVTITTAGNGGLALTALNPGSWGDNYSVQIEPNPADYTRFDLSLAFTDPSTRTKNVVETFQNLSPNAGDPQSRYVVTIINEQSAIFTAAMESPALSLTNVPGVPVPPLPTTVCAGSPPSARAESNCAYARPSGGPEGAGLEFWAWKGRQNRPGS